MEDRQIIDLYWTRDETAIDETARKYGSFCHKIAVNILSLEEDARECVNDAYYKAWTSIPPQRPASLRAWLGRVIRNIAINRWNQNHAKKRYSGMEQLLDELAECIPDSGTVEDEVECLELTAILNEWLSRLPSDERILFVRRYWYGDSLKELANRMDISSAKLAKTMYRLRLDLKSVLEKEGYRP